MYIFKETCQRWNRCDVEKGELCASLNMGHGPSEIIHETFRHHGCLKFS